MTLNAILFAILLVILAIAIKYFCKFFRIGQKNKVVDPWMTSVDPWLTSAFSEDGAPTDAQQAEMLYTSPDCITFPSVECRHCRARIDPSDEADKNPNLRCRILFRGTPKDDSDEGSWAEYEKAVKEEFAQLKMSGLLRNLELIDNSSHGQAPEATPDASNELITLMYCGFYTTALLEQHIDSRKDKLKIHTCPGCNKIANVLNVLNVPLLKLRRTWRRQVPNS